MSKKNLWVNLAAAGLVAGIAGGCNQTTKGSSADLTQTKCVSHSCQGLNCCMGQGLSGKNSCASQGSCEVTEKMLADRGCKEVLPAGTQCPPM